MEDKLFNESHVISRLDKEDLHGKWVIVKESKVREWKSDYHNKEHQLAKVVGGFGATDCSDKITRGKTFMIDTKGVDFYVYRDQILGIANAETLKEMGIEDEQSDGDIHITGHKA